MKEYAHVSESSPRGRCNSCKSSIWVCGKSSGRLHSVQGDSAVSGECPAPHAHPPFSFSERREKGGGGVGGGIPHTSLRVLAGQYRLDLSLRFWRDGFR